MYLHPHICTYIVVVTTAYVQTWQGRKECGGVGRAQLQRDVKALNSEFANCIMFQPTFGQQLECVHVSPLAFFAPLAVHISLCMHVYTRTHTYIDAPFHLN